MFLLVALVVVAAVIAVIVLIARRQPPSQSSTNRHARNVDATPPREPGKMLRPGADACAGAMTLAERWFEGNSGPRLPLKECPLATTCHCQWVRMPDRRAEHRRSGHDRRGSVRFDERPDRRSGFDRRKDMNDSWKGG